MSEQIIYNKENNFICLSSIRSIFFIKMQELGHINKVPPGLQIERESFPSSFLKEKILFFDSCGVKKDELLGYCVSTNLAMEYIGFLEKRLYIRALKKLEIDLAYKIKQDLNEASKYVSEIIKDSIPYKAFNQIPLEKTKEDNGLPNKQILDMQLTLQQAADLTGKPNYTIRYAIKSGKLSAKLSADGNYYIDAAELSRVYVLQNATFKTHTSKCNTEDITSVDQITELPKQSVIETISELPNKDKIEKALAVFHDFKELLPNELLVCSEEEKLMRTNYAVEQYTGVNLLALFGYSTDISRFNKQA